MIIRLTRVRDVPLPEYQTKGSAAFDLCSAIDAVIQPKTAERIPSGLVIATPPGYALILAPRSSLFKKKGLWLANGIGIVDSDYCGPNDEILISLYNPGETPVIIEKHERLVQGLFIPILQASFEEGTTQAQNRGGFGSTDQLK